MRLAEFSVKNSRLVNLVSVFIIIAGFVSMFHIRRDAFPLVDLDILTVTTTYPGAPAEDVEKLVTIPIEKEIRGISGIKEMTSSSEEGLSKIGITLDPEATDKKEIIDDIKRGVDRVTNLPVEIKDKPFVYELRSKDRPVIEISLGGNTTEKVRRRYAETLEDLLLDVPGVSTVSRIGWRDPEFWVEVDPAKMEAYHVSMQEVMNALNSRNVTIPGGQLTAPSLEYNIRISGEFKTADEIANVVVRANDAGNWLRVSDIANVKDTFEDETRIALINGKRALGLVVVKSQEADVIKVVANVRKVLDQFRKTLPESMEVTLTNDFSYYVKRRLGVLRNNGIIGFSLVILTLFLFLDPIPAFMTALGIPIALFSTFMVMNAMGITVNLVSMLGLIIVLGMLVDDGIIVSENVYRLVENGMPPKEAAVKGTNEVMAPVTATILTTFAAFAPLMFMPDIIGKFIKQVPIVVIVALSASLVEAFIILPSHLSDFLKVKKNHHSNQPHKKEQKLWFRKLVGFYLKTLRGALTHRYLVLAGLIVVFVSTMILAKVAMRVVMFTGEGIEFFYVRAEAPKGTPLEKTEKMLRPVEKLIESLPKSELSAYRTYVGSIENEGGWDPNAKEGTHFAQITVFLTPLQQRDRTPSEIIDALRPKIQKIKGFDKLYFYQQKEGPPTGHSIEVGIKGDDFDTLQKIARRFTDYLETVKGVTDIDTSYQTGKKQLRVMINEDKARKYYLDINTVASSVRDAFKGGIATTVKPLRAEDEINVLVRFPEEERDDLDAFGKILIPNVTGNLIPLKAVAKVEEAEGVYTISHLDGKRVIWVTGNVDGRNATSLSVNQDLKAKFKNIENEFVGYSVKYSGEYENQQESAHNLMTSFTFAFFLIFIILTAIFDSIVQPLIVMLAIPFGLVGVIIAFFLHGMPLSFFALMGLVGLTGIVVNDSVVLVDFINRLRKGGKDRRVSILEAGQARLRPVLMTSITTIGGLVSVAYGIGGGDPFLRPMALAIVWGLFFSTGLTLIIIPCIYAIIDDISEKVLRHVSVKVNHNGKTKS